LFLFPSLLVPTSPAYHEAIRFHGFHYLMNWEWYEWIGALAPAPLLWWLGTIAHRKSMPTLARACRALVIYNAIYIAIALVISIPAKFETLARIQPLRSLHLLYMVLIVIGGGFIAEYILKKKCLAMAGVVPPSLCRDVLRATKSFSRQPTG